MKKIPVQELTHEAFYRYGSFHNMTNAAELKDAHSDNEFAADLLSLDLHDEIASFSIARVSPCEMTIKAYEYHCHTCEGILPLDGDCIIFVGPSSWNPSPENLEAFRVPRGTMVRLNLGVLHGRQFCCGKEPVNVLIVLPVRTYANDCVFIELPEERQQQIVF